MRPRIIAAALCIVLATSGCAANQSSRVHSTPLPLPPRSNAPMTIVPDGPEAMYDLVNTGTLAAANDLLNNIWDIPRFTPISLPTPLTWTEDPYNQPYWRFLFYSLRPTSNLLWAYFTTHQPKYLNKLLEILTSFTAYDATNTRRDLTRLAYPHGAAFRAMVLVNDYIKLKAWGVLPDGLGVALKNSINKLGGLLASPINYNGTYNHGFTEVAALQLISVNFPALAQATIWRLLSAQRLGSLMQVTVGPDGVEIERSPFYHFYVFNFALQLQAWSARAGVALPEAFDQAVATMVRYSTDIIWPNGQVPLLGSSVQLRPQANTTLYGALMKANPQFAYAVTAGAQGSPPTERAALFSTSGQVILRSPIQKGLPYVDNSQLVFTGGPARTAHSHLDALAFSFYSNGTVLLPDSGLDTYAAGTAFDFFHGTSAHNTVVVDGLDQGPGPVTAQLVTSGPNWEYASAVADLYSGVTQKRSILLLGHNVVLVVDSLDSAQEHTYQQLWHLFPDAHLTTNGLTSEATDATDRPALQIVQGAIGPTTVQTYFGATDPLQGWYSSAYGKAQKNHVIGYTQHGSSVTYYTLITVGADAGKAASVTASGAGLRICTADTSATVKISNQAAPGEQVAVNASAGCGHGN